MGCGNSKDTVSPKGSPDNSAQNYDRRPKISVRIGEEVSKPDNDAGPNVVFVFGGPGSRKGRIVDDLCLAYGFQFVSVEELIMTDLPKKVANVMKLENVNEIRNLCDEDPTHITPEWVMLLVERRIERDININSRTYLVDFVPNLKFMLKSFSNVDCTEALNKFEVKYPISFALNLAIPAEKVLESKSTAVPCTTPDGKMSEKIENDKKPSENNKEDGMKGSGGKGDEADSSRTKRRLDLYEQSARSALDFFAKSGRLVTVDVTSGVADFIWHGVHQLMIDIEYLPRRVINTVLVFIFNSNQMQGFDLDRFEMQRVNLRDIVEDPDADVDVLLSALNSHLNKRSKETECFIIDLSQTAVTPHNVEDKSKKPITFIDVHVRALEEHLPGAPKGYSPGPNATMVKSITSLENQRCLFPVDTDDMVCQRIAAYIAIIESSQL